MFREKCHRGHTKRSLVVISGFFYMSMHISKFSLMNVSSTVVVA